MAKKTKIGWTDHTFNFHKGCTRVSAECDFCYIEPILKRAGIEPFGGAIRTTPQYWKQAFKWDRDARADGVRRRVFTCSISDFFHPGATWLPEAWALIRACSQLDWLILTKRPQLIDKRLPPDWGGGYANVWLGVSVGWMKSKSRIERLLDIPARCRFISAEPLLGPVDFRPYLNRGIDWIISGCERAHKKKRRLMNLDWVRDIDRHCREAGVAHFFKQYYQDNKGVPVEDGMLDGNKRQEWPKPRRR